MPKRKKMPVPDSNVLINQVIKNNYIKIFSGKSRIYLSEFVDNTNLEKRLMYIQPYAKNDSCTWEAYLDGKKYTGALNQKTLNETLNSIKAQS